MEKLPTEVKVIGIIVVTIIVMVFFATALLIVGQSNTDVTVATADGFTIDSYKVILNVMTDNTVYVTEKITVNWYETNHHGILKFTPQWLEYTDKNGKTIKRKSKISNLKAVGDLYSVDWVNKKARIKIGSANSYVDRGLKTYIIEYTYDMGKDPYKGFDEFIFHAYGDYWGTEIKNASITVNMPKSIDGYNVNFFTDKYRQNSVKDYVSYTISGNTLNATFDRGKYYQDTGKRLNQSLTVDIELPEGYFEGGSSNYGYGSLIISIIIFVLTIYTYFMWRKYGKNYPKKIPAIKYYPPDNLSSAEIGYIYNDWQSTSKLAISLILSLAAKGHIKIDEIDDKKHIQITNNRKPDLLDLNIYENIIYKKLFEENDVVVLNEHKTLYTAFSSIETTLRDNCKYKIKDEESSSKRKKSIITTIAIALLSIISYFAVEDLNPKFGMLYYISFGCILINLFFTFIMGRKTIYGETISAEVQGFKIFLETAEKEKLEALVEKEPQYFYQILPYTYVLDISKKWIKKFEDIPMPEVDMGNFDYMNDSDFHFYNIYADIYQPPSTYSGGGSGSSCGGGCSSCGGGCSSCGGGGSW